MVHLAIWSRWNWPGILRVKVHFPVSLRKSRQEMGNCVWFKFKFQVVEMVGFVMGIFYDYFTLGWEKMCWPESWASWCHTPPQQVSQVQWMQTREGGVQILCKVGGGRLAALRCRCWEVKCNNIADCWATQANIEARSGLTLTRTHETSHLLEIKIYPFWVAAVISPERS